MDERPKLPPKKMFFNMSAEFVAQRTEDLNSYLRQIVLNHALRNSSAMREFLDKNLVRKCQPPTVLTAIGRFLCGL